jgi:hypothetical protein
MQVIYNFFLYNKKKIKNILCGCKIYIYIAIPHQNNYEMIHVDISYKKIRGKVLIN